MYGAQPSVTMPAIRVEIGDQPRLCVPPGRYELVANPADGVTTSFPLKFRKAILSTLRVWIAVLPTERNANPPLYVEVQSNDATSSWSAGVDASNLPVVTFDLPPPINSLIGVRYDVVMFTDAEIATYIPDNVRSTASLTLKAIHYSLIPVMLADRDALMVSRIGERTDDPAQWIQAQRAMMSMLAAFLITSRARVRLAAFPRRTGAGRTSDDWHSMIEIYIDGVVAMPNRGDTGAAHEEFWGEFGKFVESKGWLFGGGTGIVKSDSSG